MHDQYDLSNFSDTRLFIDSNDGKIHRIYDLEIDFFHNYGFICNTFENSSIILKILSVPEPTIRCRIFYIKIFGKYEQIKIQWV